MRTVPAYIATLLSTQPIIEATIAKELAASGRLVGARAELDLDKLAAATSEQVAEAVLDYHQKCLLFQEYLGARQSGYKNENRPAIQIRRPLLSAVQIDRKGGRKDLKSEMDALIDVPILGQFVSTLLDSKSSPKRQVDLDRLAAALAVEIQDLPENKTVATVSMPSGKHPWSAQLGGAATPGEVDRIFIITTSHATWRDRRVRRLLSLEVVVDELWAHPVTAAVAIARVLPPELLLKTTGGQ